MEYLWKGKKLFMKDLLNCFPDPKPAATTVATQLKRMLDKGVIAFRTYGNSREYFPIISKEEYFTNHFDQLIKGFFNNSALQFASFFARNSNLSQDELQRLRNLVDQQIQEKNDGKDGNDNH
jgi:BlaI family penicillinase repressor